MKASILVQETRILSYREVVKWKFEEIDLGKWLEKTHSRKKEYVCEKSSKIGKTREYLIAVIECSVKRRLSKIFHKIPLNKLVFDQVSHGILPKYIS